MQNKVTKTKSQLNVMLLHTENSGHTIYTLTIYFFPAGNPAFLERTCSMLSAPLHSLCPLQDPSPMVLQSL